MSKPGRSDILKTMLVLTAILASHGAISAQAGADSVLATLEGSWEGEGELMGRSATFTMTWERALNGRFLRLEFRNAFADVDPVQPVLEANAYYLLGSPELRGQWMDSRGVILTLRAEVVGSALVTHWSGSESGRTEYRVIDDNELEVVDYVHSGGEDHLFAKARYRRVGSR